MNDEKGFLDAIRANPDDDAARLVYADWLDERGDIRGQYLRLEYQLWQLPLLMAQLQQQIRQLRQQIDPHWVSAVSKRQRVVLASVWPTNKIPVIKRVREVTGLGLKEAKDLVETPRAIIKDNLTMLEAEQLAALFDGIAEVAIETSVGS